MMILSPTICSLQLAILETIANTDPVAGALIIKRTMEITERLTGKPGDVTAPTVHDAMMAELERIMTIIEETKQ